MLTFFSAAMSWALSRCSLGKVLNMSSKSFISRTSFWASFSCFRRSFITCNLTENRVTTGFWGKEAWHLPQKWNTRVFFAFSKRTQPCLPQVWRKWENYFKPRVALANFIGKMQKKSMVLWKVGWTLTLFLLDDLLKEKNVNLVVLFWSSCVTQLKDPWFCSKIYPKFNPD